MIDNTKVGNAISALRQAKNLTQQQLAAVLNVSHQAVSKWENGLAIPDIETLSSLTKLFGVTMEQLLSGDIPADRLSGAGKFTFTDLGDKAKNVINSIGRMFDSGNADPEEDAEPVDIAQILGAAPFMSKDALQKQLLRPGVKLSLAELRTVAPFVGSDALEQLIERSGIPIAWDMLTPFAPFLRRDAVDRMVAAAQNGEPYKRPEADVGKAFDEFGRTIGSGIDRAVHGVIEFGTQVGSGIAAAFDLNKQTAEMSDRAKDVRRKVFEKALADEKWDWLGSHISEITDKEFLANVANAAREAGMDEWISEYMPDYAGENPVDQAVEGGNWDHLGELVNAMDPDQQVRAARAAMEAGKWDWLRQYQSSMELSSIAAEISLKAIAAQQRDLAVEVLEQHGEPEDISSVCDVAIAGSDMILLNALLGLADADYISGTLTAMAKAGRWEDVSRLASLADPDTAASLTELAIEAGAWDAIDSLSEKLK